MAKISRKNRNSVQDLGKIKIKTIIGETFSLDELVDYEFKRGKVKVNHINGSKEIRVDEVYIMPNSSKIAK